MPLQFRKGTDGQRAAVTFAQGEPVWTTDLHQLWVGDGSTPGGILITGGTGTSGGYISTSSISAGGNKLQINIDGSLAFPLNNTLVSTQTFKISALGTTATFNSDGVIIANPVANSSAATLFVNNSSATSYPVPNLDGVAVWMLGSNNESTRIVSDNYGTGQNTWTGRDANGVAQAPTAATTGNVLLRVGGIGYGSTTFGTNHSAFIDFTALERFTDASKGGAVLINTLNQGTLVSNTSMSVNSRGVTIATAQTNTSYGPLFVNASTNPGPAAAQGDLIFYGLQRNNSKGRVAVDVYSNTGTDTIDNMSAIFTGRRARGTLAVPVAVKDGDSLSRFNGFGYDGTKFASSSSGYIAVKAAEDFTARANGGFVEIGVLNTGTTNTYITTIIDQTGLRTQSINASVDIDAVGDINSQNNMIANNNLTAGRNLYVGDNAYISGTELVGGELTAGSIVSNSTIAATTNITAGGNITATGDITGNDITATGHIEAGSYIYSAASIHAKTYLWAETKVSATTFVSAGTTISAGTDITAGRNITATGDITGNDFTASGTITASGAISGASVSASGNVTAGATVQGANLVATGLTNVVTTNYLFYNTTTGAITYGPDVEINPFNQDLNTFDSPTFAGLTLNGALNASTWTYAGSSVTLDANSLNVTTGPDATHSSIFINESGSSSYVNPTSGGSVVWAINKVSNPTRFLGDTYDTTNSTFYTGRRARGSAASPSAVQTSDVLNRINAFGYGSTGFNSNSSAFINFVAKENFTDSAMGSQILLGTMTPGTTTQVTRLTVDNNGLLVAGDVLPSGSQDLGSSGSPWTNVYAGFVRGVGQITFGDTTIQTTAWTGSVSTSTVSGLATIAWTGKLSDGTGQISTSTVSGLSTVGYTNKYADLTGGPNQTLNTTSAVQFAGITDTGALSVTGFSSLAGGATLSAATVTNNLSAGATTLQSLSVTTGTALTKTLSVGGYPLNSAGTASFVISTGNSPIGFFSNYTAGVLPQVIVRGYGQNNPNGGAATNPSTLVRLQAAYGTSASPTAMLASNTIGGFTADAYDGRNWASDYGATPNFMGWFSTEAYTNDGSTSTLQAGAGFNIYSQPGWTRPGVNASRMRWFFQNWTTATGGPSQANIFIGSGVVNDGAPTNTMVDGTTYTGWGKTNLTFVNAGTSFYGVTSTDSAPSNAALTNTNFINLVGNRKNGSQTLRNAVVQGDNLYIINFRGQNNYNQSGSGVVGASIAATALDTFTSTQYGTSMSIATVNTGTTTSRNRLVLSDRLMSLSADQYQFNNGNYTATPLSFTTSTWNASADSTVFGNTAGTVSMLTMNTTQNDYRNTTHAFKDRTGSFTALNMTTSTAVFTAIPVVPNYTKAQAATITGQIGAQIAISDSASGGNPNGMMAFWDTTNSRWSYIHDNSAV